MLIKLLKKMKTNSEKLLELKIIKEDAITLRDIASKKIDNMYAQISKNKHLNCFFDENEKEETKNGEL